MAHDKREEQHRAEVEVAARLRSRGIDLSGRETDEELVELLEAVEAFERVVKRHGGDLMVDEPIASGRVQEPDNRRFVLPRRREGEAVKAYLERIADAADRAAR